MFVWTNEVRVSPGRCLTPCSAAARCSPDPRWATRPAGSRRSHGSASSAAAPGPITNHVKVLSSHSGISRRHDHRIQYLFYLHLVEDLAPLRELGAVAPGLEVLGQRHLVR